MKDKITITIKGVVLEGLDWVSLVLQLPLTGSCEHGTQNSVSIKHGGFLDI
jgi:hypothetical protein